MLKFEIKKVFSKPKKNCGDIIICCIGGNQYFDNKQSGIC